MFFSVIIPVRTITNYLRESIPYLKALTHSKFEVLIFTDGKEYIKLPTNFKIIPTGVVGPAEKRNLAIKYAKGDVLAFLDDDAYPTKEWLSIAEKAFSESDVCAVGGPSVTPRNEGFLEKASGVLLESPLVSGGTTDRYIPLKKRYVDDYPTVNLFVSKKDFKAVNGFTTEFWPGEDTKLCLDLIKATHKKILYEPDLLVFHHRRKLFRPHLTQIGRYGRHRGQFTRIFPENSRKPMYFVPSLFLLGVITGPLLGFFINSLFYYIYFLVLTIYVSLVLVEAIRTYIRCRNLPLTFYFCLGVVLTHTVYGFNFLYGLLSRPKLELRKVQKGTYLGG